MIDTVTIQKLPPFSLFIYKRYKDHAYINFLIVTIYSYNDLSSLKRYQKGSNSEESTLRAFDNFERM